MKFKNNLSVFCFLLATLLLIFSFTSAQAAPVGSPATLLKKGEWTFTIEGAHLSRRPMESSDNIDYEVSMTHGYHARSYGLTDRLTIKGKAGGTYAYLYDEDPTTKGDKTSLSGGLGLGIQLKGSIIKNNVSGFEWDASGQFLCMRSHHKRSGKANADWYEWQAATCVAKKIGRFKPYAGVKCSIVDLDRDDGEGNTVSYDEDGSVGPFIGADIYFGRDKDVIFNLEGGFLLGDEFSGGLRYKF
jgi:hypothetical protein